MVSTARPKGLESHSFSHMGSTGPSTSAFSSTLAGRSIGNGIAGTHTSILMGHCHGRCTSSPLCHKALGMPFFLKKFVFYLISKGRVRGKREIPYLLVYSPTACNSCDWIRPKPGASWSTWVTQAQILEQSLVPARIRIRGSGIRRSGAIPALWHRMQVSQAAAYLRCHNTCFLTRPSFDGSLPHEISCGNFCLCCHVNNPQIQILKDFSFLDWGCSTWLGVYD